MADDVYSRIQVIDSETDDEDINSYFVDALTNQVLEDLENNGYTETQAYTLLYSGGLNIYSTQDPEIQKIADDYCSNEDNYPADTHYLLDYRLSVRNSEGFGRRPHQLQLGNAAGMDEGKQPRQFA